MINSRKTRPVLATHDHFERRGAGGVGACVLMEDGSAWTINPDGTPRGLTSDAERERHLVTTYDPRIWRPLRSF
jgi:hypothetical protein